MLEAALQERAQVLFQVLLQYVTDLMVWEEGGALPEELEPRSARLDSYTTTQFQEYMIFFFLCSRYTACSLRLQKCSF